MFTSKRVFKFTLIAASIALAPLAVAPLSLVTASAQQAQQVGELHNISAWIDLQPGPDRPTLHIVGSITAPTPCHTVSASYEGDEKSNPPIYLLKVSLDAGKGICPQVLTNLSFHHTQDKFAGNHLQAKIFHGDGPVTTVDIERIQ